jgi:hypothetical protein
MEAEAFGGGGGSSSVYRSRVAAAARAIAAAASAAVLPPAAYSAVQAAATAAAAGTCSDGVANDAASRPQSGELGQPSESPPDGRNASVTPAATALAADSAGLLAQFDKLQDSLAADHTAAAVASLQRLGSTAVTTALLAETGADSVDVLCLSRAHGLPLDQASESHPLLRTLPQSLDFTSDGGAAGLGRKLKPLTKHSDTAVAAAAAATVAAWKSAVLAQRRQ